MSQKKLSVITGTSSGIDGAIHADDVAKAITFAYCQPQNVCIREIVLEPTRQEP